MSCDNIIIEEQNDTTLITSNQEDVIVKDGDAVTEIISSQDDYVVVSEVKDTIIIDSCDVNLIVTPVGSNYESFVPAQGQTIFTLSNIPTGSQINLSKVFVNGQKIAFPACYTISGSQLTVILPYTLTPNDLLEIYY